jgi:hypothetical protein
MTFSVLSAPSGFALAFTGLSIGIVLVYVFMNYRELRQLRSPQLIQLGVLIAILVGVHGLLHLGMEKNYGYNPLGQLKCACKGFNGKCMCTPETCACRKMGHKCPCMSA